MTRNLILGTAGHIDHGKTSLVKVLTGVDCDRLPEEKARGITIDIGFAHLKLGEYHLGIVDVPGHERFIKNMLAGATSIDMVLFIVAADDSVMPQTREHLEILRLLDIQHGVIALTKADLVDEATRELVMYDIRELVENSFLAQAPIIPTSVHTKLGIEELKHVLEAECAKINQQRTSEWFRLAIDRSFVSQGHGTVVTGSVISGTLRIGDELEWLPRQEKVRVRSLRNHDQVVEEVTRGQRAAINLAGVAHEDIQRGQELATPGYLLPSTVVTVRLQTLPGNRRPIRHRLPVRLYLGTSEAMAVVSLLDCDTIDPGKWGLAQLFLDNPVTCVWGQAFVLRDSSAENTLGGGQILQPNPIKIRRRHLEMLEQIEKLWAVDATIRAETAVWLSGYTGITSEQLVRETGLGPQEAENTLQTLQEANKIVEVLSKRRIHSDRIVELENNILETSGYMHTNNPLMTTLDRQKVLSQLTHFADEPLLQSTTDRLIRAKKLVGDSQRIARADFKPRLSTNQRKLKDKIVGTHQTSRFQPPDPKSFHELAAGNVASLKDIFEVAIAEGYLVRINDEIYLHTSAENEMRQRLEERLATGIGLTVADIRDLLGTTRKYAIPLCEYLDRIGLTRREGDLRFAKAMKAPQQ